MQLRLQILLMLSSLLVFFITLDLIRRGRLREEYSLIWLVGAVMIFILSVFKGSLRLIADFVQIGYPPSFIFMVGLGVIVAIQLLQTIIISKLTTQNRDLAQRLAILEWCLQRLSEIRSETKVSTTKPTTIEAAVDNMGEDSRRYEQAKIVGDRS